MHFQTHGTTHGKQIFPTLYQPHLTHPNSLFNPTHGRLWYCVSPNGKTMPVRIDRIIRYKAKKIDNNNNNNNIDDLNRGPWVKCGLRICGPYTVV